MPSAIEDSGFLDVRTEDPFINLKDWEPTTNFYNVCDDQVFDIIKQGDVEVIEWYK